MTEELLKEENQKFWRNMMEVDERRCASKLASGFPCTNCELKRCIHPEKAIWGPKRH